jgi:uncharacterized FlaG/YvyC family protein
MDSIDTRIAIGRMAASIGARSQSKSLSGKLSVKDAAEKPGPDHTYLDPVRTEASFSTYGSRNERIAIVVKNKETGEIIREIPSEEMQKLHVHIDMLI